MPVSEYPDDFFPHDNDIREMSFYENGEEFLIQVRGFDPASEIGSYLNDVKQFLHTGNEYLLARYEGEKIVDIYGVEHYFETDPDMLFDIYDEGLEFTGENMYRIVG